MTASCARYASSIQQVNDNDDQDKTEDTDAAVTIPVTVAAESATEATIQRISRVVVSLFHCLR